MSSLTSYSKFRAEIYVHYMFIAWSYVHSLFRCNDKSLNEMGLFITK